MAGRTRRHGAVAPTARKRLGQHFLVDRGALDRIISRADFSSTDQVLEVGPGVGALTLPLAEQVGRIVAVEKDSALVERLQQRLNTTGIDNVQVIRGDILRCDIPGLRPDPGRLLCVAGNLPYNISTPILEKLTACRNLLGRAVLMFQKEVGERLAAAPGVKAYGAMTVLVQYCATVRPLLTVSSRSFAPRPKVDALVVELDFTRPYARRAPDDAAFRRLVRAAFSHRRKTLLNSLAQVEPVLSRADLALKVRKAGIDPDVRAESLGMEQFLNLADALRLTND